MRSEVLALAVMVGACNWVFRYLPMRADLSGMKPDGVLARFLAATGPAAIATLFVASVMPWVQTGVHEPLVAGTLAVLAAFWASRSVVVATLVGSAGYGLVFWGLA